MAIIEGKRTSLKGPHALKKEQFLMFMSLLLPKRRYVVSKFSTLLIMTFNIDGMHNLYSKFAAT